MKNKIYLFKLKYNTDLLEEITKFCKKNKIQKGLINGIGAVQNVTLGYYNQEKKEYQQNFLNIKSEIVSLSGNVSLLENKIFPHIHIIVADEKTKTYGGHLFSPTKVFACEVSIIEINDNNLLYRNFDEITKLNLW